MPITDFFYVLCIKVAREIYQNKSNKFPMDQLDEFLSRIFLFFIYI